jgi:hypothetical protein
MHVVKAYIYVEIHRRIGGIHIYIGVGVVDKHAVKLLPLVTWIEMEAVETNVMKVVLFSVTVAIS